MNHPKLAFVACALACLPLAACEEFDPPPEVSLRSPEEGVYTSGDPLFLEFSESINPDTLAIRIWPVETDQEGELLGSAAPLLERCTIAMSPCGTTTFSLDDTKQVATVQLDPADLGKADSPFILEILPGLEDEQGRDRSAITRFDVQFSPAAGAGTGELQDGHYFIVGSTTEPLPAGLRLVTEFITLDDGRIALAGAQGKVVGGAPKNTENIDDIEMETGPNGFTIHGYATLSNTDGGERFLKTDPFEVNIVVGAIHISLHEAIVQGKILKDDAGNDFIDGNLNFSGVTLVTGNGTTEFDGSNATVKGIFVPPDKVPPGGPVLCGDLCGDIPQCEPPDAFPGDDFCAPEE